MQSVLLRCLLNQDSQDPGLQVKSTVDGKMNRVDFLLLLYNFELLSMFTHFSNSLLFVQKTNEIKSYKIWIFDMKNSQKNHLLG